MAVGDFAVVIGICRYPALRDLEGPVQDAELFRTWLCGEGQVPEDNVELVTSSDPPAPGDRPIQQDINDAFRRVFDAAGSIEARRLYVYFAGHGAAQEINHVALLMANASVQDLGYGLDAMSYQQGLARLGQFPEQVMFYDCCRNFDRRVAGYGPPWTRDAPGTGAAFVRQFVLFAAGFTEYAHERSLIFNEPWGSKRGLFTQALIEGLKGKAAERYDGRWIVSNLSLMAYVEDRLEQLTKGENVRQHLGWNPAGRTTKIELVEVDSVPLYPLVVRVSGGNAVVIEDWPGHVFDRRPVAGGEVRFDLPMAYYGVKVEPNGPEQTVGVGLGKPTELEF